MSEIFSLLIEYLGMNGKIILKGMLDDKCLSGGALLTWCWNFGYHERLGISIIEQISHFRHLMFCVCCEVGIDLCIKTINRARDFEKRDEIEMSQSNISVTVLYGSNTWVWTTNTNLIQVPEIRYLQVSRDVPIEIKLIRRSGKYLWSLLSVKCFILYCEAS